MKKYAVCLPFTGYRYLEVEAASEEEALDKAYEVEFDQDQIQEMEHHSIVAEGNIFHGVMNEYSVEEIGD